MADWTYVPRYSQVIRDEPPPTLIHTFADGSELRRAKHSSYWRTFRERYVVNATDADGIRDFFRLKGLVTAFTKVTYDEREAGGAEATVRFVGVMERNRTATGRYEFDIEFREVPS